MANLALKQKCRVQKIYSMLKLMGKKIFTILCSKLFSILTYVNDRHVKVQHIADTIGINAASVHTVNSYGRVRMVSSPNHIFFLASLTSG